MHPAVGQFGPQGCGDPHTVGPRHLQIEHGDVGLVGPRHGQRLGPGGRLGDDHQIVLQAEQRGERARGSGARRRRAARARCPPGLPSLLSLTSGVAPRSSTVRRRPAALRPSPGTPPVRMLPATPPPSSRSRRPRPATAQLREPSPSRHARTPPARAQGGPGGPGPVVLHAQRPPRPARHPTPHRRSAGRPRAAARSSSPPARPSRAPTAPGPGSPAAGARHVAGDPRRGQHALRARKFGRQVGLAVAAYDLPHLALRLPGDALHLGHLVHGLGPSAPRELHRQLALERDHGEIAAHHVVQIAPEPQPFLGDGEPRPGLAGRVEFVDGVQQPDGEAGGEGEDPRR